MTILETPALTEWRQRMSDHEAAEAAFFERVRTGRQADLESAAHAAYWQSRQEVHVCGVHGERPVSVPACTGCDAGAMSTCEMCGTLFPARRKTARYCSQACQKRAHRVRVTEEAESGV